ncbi:hypothetical protein, partial [Enterobacter cloacae]|uniref:hypothetical protein n=1 Tax=Enterobacter cloacae TaxID=550 RepID=UPI0025507B91
TRSSRKKSGAALPVVKNKHLAWSSDHAFSPQYSSRPWPASGKITLQIILINFDLDNKNSREEYYETRL